MSKKPRISDLQIRMILSLLGDGSKTWDDIQFEAGCHRETISNVKKWYNSIPWPAAKIYTEGDEIILKARTDYLEKKAEEIPQIDNLLQQRFAQPSVKALTAEEIVIEEERKQAILAHFEDLRAIARRWNSELWLPPPWQWDVAHLEYVFYIDTKKSGVAGYKLPAALVSSEESNEESKGHFRHFEEGDVHWVVQDDGPIILKVPIEDEVAFGYLKAHTQESSGWRLLTEWDEKGGTYIRLCSSLLARIEQDAKEAIGAKSELSWWSIYHDAFCTEDTLLRCGRCGTENPDAFTCLICGGKFSRAEEIELHIDNNHPEADPKAWLLPHCQNCFMPLGWLQPFVKRYEQLTGNNPESCRIHINGWANIEESVEIERFESYTRGHADLRDKYRGCELVETILEAEKEVRQVQGRLIGEITSLSEQRVFHGNCPACPDY